jgi:hypothetical protein
MQLKEYSQLNQSFEKVLVFHFGSRAGFFSEYNTMLQAMIYCLQHRIRFEMYSADANCSIRRGWTDFFEPFCKERTSPLHYAFNTRSPSPGLKFWLRKNLGGPLLRASSKCDFLTYDLWNQFRSLNWNDHLEIPELNWNGQVHSLRRHLISMTWRFNPYIKPKIDKEISKLGLPNGYVAIHVRAGDKIKEYHGNPLEDYMEKASSLTGVREVLVMTDDYRIYETLRNNFRDFTFYTLESPDQKGYQHRKNKRKSITEKANDYIRFFAGIEASIKADLCVGTLSSNVGQFMSMKMNKGQFCAVDA